MIIVYFKNDLTRDKKEEFLQNYIYKGLNIKDRDDLFKVSVDSYFNIIQTLDGNIPHLTEIMNLLYQKISEMDKNSSEIFIMLHLVGNFHSFFSTYCQDFIQTQFSMLEQFLMKTSQNISTK